MKKFFYLTTMLMFVVGFSYAQHPGGSHHGGQPGDSTAVCDSTGVGHPGHPGHPGDSTVVCDSTGIGNPGHPGHPGHPGDSTAVCDSTGIGNLGHHGHPWHGGHGFPGGCDSTMIDSLGNLGHPWHGSHFGGHHGGICDSTIVVDDSTDTSGGESNFKTVFSSVKVTIFPNPVSNELTIDFGSASLEGVQVEIYSVNGQLLESTTRNANGQFKLDVSSLDKGNYIVVLRQGNESLTSRFVK
jgi:hypothetical protein